MNLRMKTPTEVRRTLQKISNMVLNSELDAKRANTIILACNAILSAIRTDDQQKKIQELENVLEEIRKR